MTALTDRATTTILNALCHGGEEQTADHQRYCVRSYAIAEALAAVGLLHDADAVTAEQDRLRALLIEVGSLPSRLRSFDLDTVNAYDVAVPAALLARIREATEL